jgi:hypothetical protein
MYRTFYVLMFKNCIINLLSNILHWGIFYCAGFILLVKCENIRSYILYSTLSVRHRSVLFTGEYKTKLEQVKVNILYDSKLRDSL